MIYLRGSVGLEIHFTNDGPFDIDGNETIDVDAVFKQEYDQQAIRILGGGCVWTQDELFEDALHLMATNQEMSHSHNMPIEACFPNHDELLMLESCATVQNNILQFD